MGKVIDIQAWQAQAGSKCAPVDDGERLWVSPVHGMRLLIRGGFEDEVLRQALLKLLKSRSDERVLCRKQTHEDWLASLSIPGD